MKKTALMHTYTYKQCADNLTLCWQRLSMRVQSWMPKWQQLRQTDSLSLFAVHCYYICCGNIMAKKKMIAESESQHGGENYLPRENFTERWEDDELKHKNIKWGEHTIQLKVYWRKLRLGYFKQIRFGSYSSNTASMSSVVTATTIYGEHYWTILNMLFLTD